MSPYALLRSRPSAVLVWLLAPQGQASVPLFYARSPSAAPRFAHIYPPYSVCVYESKANEYVDFKQPYNEPLDLKKLVKVDVYKRQAS